MNDEEFDVTFYTYSGMSMLIARACDRDEVKRHLKRWFRRAKHWSQPVTKIGKGTWEFETPEDAFAISDYDGVMEVRLSQPVRR